MNKKQLKALNDSPTWPLVLAFALAIEENLRGASEEFKKETQIKPLMQAVAGKYGELENSLMYPGVDSVLRYSSELAAICVKVTELMKQLKPVDLVVTGKK